MKVIHTQGGRKIKETTVAELISALLILKQDQVIVSSYEGMHGTVDAEIICEDVTTYTEPVYELNVEKY